MASDTTPLPLNRLAPADRTDVSPLQGLPIVGEGLYAGREAVATPSTVVSFSGVGSTIARYTCVLLCTDVGLLQHHSIV